MDNASKRTYTIIIAVLTAVILVFLSVFLTLALAGGVKAGAWSGYESRSEDYDTRYLKLDSIYRRLMDDYYIDVDSDTLMQGAIDGMMASLDDQFTFYYTPEEMSSTNARRSGNYVGIGVQVTRNEENYIRIVRVFTDSPALEAGLRKNDIIYSADGIELRPQNDMELTDSVAIIKNGEEGTYTQLEILRDGGLFSVSVQRRAVTEDRVEYEILDGDVGYILLYDFFGNAMDGVKSALQYFKENDVKGIIFDVRDNPGGSLEYCIGITDNFIDGGIIVYTEDRYGGRVNYNATSGSVDLPLIVLVNGNSASASEIFAAAIQEAGAGTIVGETTYGKGIVQTQYGFEDGSAMQLTTSAYYTQNGKSIHKVGVQPDVEVVFDLEIAQNEERDNQLEAALELIRQKIDNEP